MDERDTTSRAEGADAPIGGRPDEQPDDVTFEVTDLTTGSNRAHPLAATPRLARTTPSAQRTRLIEVAHAPTRVIVTLDARALRIGLAAVALLLVAGIVLSNLPRLGHNWFAYAPLSSPTPEVVSQVTFSIAADTVTPQPTLAPTATIPLPPLGSIPQNCSPGQTAPSVGAPGLGTAVGQDPVWVDAFDGPTATLSIPAHGGNQFTQYGWQVGIELVFTNSYSAPVTLVGNDLTTNLPLWFGPSNPPADPNAISSSPTTTFTIDAQQAEVNGGGAGSGAVFYPITMYLPGADCYHLAATWPSGRWQIAFAAGA